MKWNNKTMEKQAGEMGTGMKLWEKSGQKASARRASLLPSF
jgi:hypothetical protein